MSAAWSALDRHIDLTGCAIFETKRVEQSALISPPPPHPRAGPPPPARALPLASGARYLNSGTWADLLQFPKDILSGSQSDVRDKLRHFCEDAANSRLERYIVFTPTFVRLDVTGDGRVARAELLDYTGPESL